MNFRTLIIVELLLLSTTLMALNNPPQREMINNMRLSLEVPQNFQPASRFNGFQDPEMESTVLITRHSTAYTVFADSISPATLSVKNMVLLEKSEEMLDGHTATLIKASESIDGRTLLKWMLFIGDDSETYVVTAQFPKLIEKFVSADMKKLVMSARLRDESELDPFANFPFTIKIIPPLQMGATVPDNTVSLVKEGFPLGTLNTEPVMLIGPLVIDDKEVDQKTASLTALKMNKGISNISIQKQQPLTVSDLKGYEIIAEALHNRFLDTKMLVYQATLFDEQGHAWILRGQAGKDKAEDSLALFREITASFHLREMPE